MEYKISIIVPVYKVEKYLGKCIESILGQTFKDFELILVDDGSPDNCGVICENFAKRDERIKVIHKSNGGLSSARNAGLEMATGEYIAFVDSDDFIHQRMYEILYKYAKKYSSDIVICDYLLVNEGESYIDELRNFEINAKNFSNIDALKQIYTNNGTTFIVAWNKLYRRYLFNDLRFEEGRLHEDEFMAHKILYASPKVTYLPIPLYSYLQRRGSIIGSGFNLKRLDAVYAAKDRIKFFKKIKQSKLRQKAEYNYIKMFFFYYLKAKKECENPEVELKVLKSGFLDSFNTLIFNPLFNFKEKLLWIAFIINPLLFEFYINCKN
jgi:glycosyltransferase involved in cell wall biosynthesis